MSAALPSLLSKPERRRIGLRAPGLRWVSPLAILALWQLASTTGVLPATSSRRRP